MKNIILGGLFLIMWGASAEVGAIQDVYDYVVLGLGKSGKAVVWDNGQKRDLLDDSGNPVQFQKYVDVAIEIMESRGYEYVTTMDNLDSNWGFAILMRKQKVLLNNN